jgi:GNAT superfamily N-acetyltransferase
MHATMADLEIRWLDGEALRELEPTLKARGWMALNKETSRAIAAFDNGRLVGFFVLQAVPYLGPLYVDTGWRGTGVSTQLVDAMVEFLRDISCRGAMLVAENPHASRLAEAFKMERINSPIYQKVDMGEGL